MKGTLSDAQLNFFGLSLSHALAEGRSFSLDFEEDIVAAGSYTIDFVTNIDPVQLAIVNVNTLSTHSHYAFYSGGSYSAGGPLTPFNLNFSLPTQPDPLASIDGGVTVDVAGALIREKHLLGSGIGINRSIVSGGSEVGMIFAGNSQYSLTITNNDVGNQDFDIGLIFVRLKL